MKSDEIPSEHAGVNSRGSTEKPTLVFVHGAWHLPDCWDLVTSQLKRLHYPIRNISLLSAGGDLTTTVADDAAHIRQTLSELVDAGKEVILVMHSYGGIPSSDSAKGLLRNDYLAEGRSGGVIALVFITAFALPVGQSIWSFLGAWPPWLIFDGNKMTAESAADILYHDLPESQHERRIAKLVHQSKPSFYGDQTYAAYLDTPSFYLLCEQDKPLPISIQRKMMDSMGPKCTARVCTAGHMVMLSQPDKVVAIVREAAGDVLH